MPSRTTPGSCRGRLAAAICGRLFALGFGFFFFCFFRALLFFTEHPYFIFSLLFFSSSLWSSFFLRRHGPPARTLLFFLPPLRSLRLLASTCETGKGSHAALSCEREPTRRRVTKKKGGATKGKKAEGPA
nr:hypothetical protein [Pandoravirus belohorizontensis]